MGEVRNTIETPSSKSPKFQLREISEQISDLIDIKKLDLKSEGPSMEKRNKKSIDCLQDALDSIAKAIKQLEKY